MRQDQKYMLAAIEQARKDVYHNAKPKGWVRFS